jgi:hypothetical protein
LDGLTNLIIVFQLKKEREAIEDEENPALSGLGCTFDYKR